MPDLNVFVHCYRWEGIDWELIVIPGKELIVISGKELIVISDRHFYISGKELIAISVFVNLKPNGLYYLVV